MIGPVEKATAYKSDNMPAWTLLSSRLVESARRIRTIYKVFAQYSLGFIKHQRTESKAAAPTPATPRPMSNTGIELAPVLIAEPP